MKLKESVENIQQKKELREGIRKLGLCSKGLFNLVMDVYLYTLNKDIL